ncbi:MAG: BrxA family protein [Pirellulaceae bacterium]
MKCTLEVDHSRSYWQACGEVGRPVTTAEAFEKAIFGSRTYSRVERLISDMRHRFDAFPSSLNVLMRWADVKPSDRTVICHLHTQLADPLYRQFTGTFLVERFESLRSSIDRELVIDWIESSVPGRWKVPSRSKIASKMMTSAMTVGLLESNRDPRSIAFPRVSDTVITYLMYLLREVDFAGTLLKSPYVASLGFDLETLVGRLRTIPSLGFNRQGDLLHFGWQHESLMQWAEHELSLTPAVAPALSANHVEAS